MDTCWVSGENHFSSMECQCVYHHHSKAAPMPRNSWPTQNGLHIVLCFFFFFLLLVFHLHVCLQARREHQISIENWELTHSCWELNSGPWEEQSELLALSHLPCLFCVILVLVFLSYYFIFSLFLVCLDFFS